MLKVQQTLGSLDIGKPRHISFSTSEEPNRDSNCVSGEYHSGWRGGRLNVIVQVLEFIRLQENCQRGPRWTFSDKEFSNLNSLPDVRVRYHGSFLCSQSDICLSLNKPKNIVCTATELRNVWSANCYAFIPTGRHGLVAVTLAFLFKKPCIQVLDKTQTILKFFVVFFGHSRKI